MGIYEEGGERPWTVFHRLAFYAVVAVGAVILFTLIGLSAISRTIGGRR